MKHWLLVAGISVSLLYGSICGLFYLTQKQLIFVPPGKMSPPPAGYDIEEINFTTSDGNRLNGWFIDNDGDRTVLFCHGNGANISNLEFFMKIFQEIGLNALFFDYRGYGKSGGSIRAEEDLYRDVIAAHQYLREEKGFTSDRIIVWGRSIGGAPALELARRENLHAVILQSTFTSLTERIQEMAPVIPVKPLSKFHYPNREKIGRIGSPILIVHSVDDGLIPFSHGQALYRAAKEPKSLITLTGPHNSVPDECVPVLLNGVKSFIDEPYKGVYRCDPESDNGGATKSTSR
ncbi:MAG: alpha/beta hydrolase [Candidatus Bipolaricaulota bacterium]|nr:alpha/beta hydrolase [Candidatus Bipolaricaulota bacterium]